MSQIAFVWNDVNYYWSTLVLCCALGAAILALLGIRLLQGKLADAAVFLPLALALGACGGRLQHWYCFYRQYRDLEQAFTDFSVGGFCLTGAIVGVLLAAILVRALFLTRDLPGLLDAAAAAGALGIAVGRLSAAFYSAAHGKNVFESETLHGLPFSTPLTNTAGGTDWRSAVFFWESIVTFLIFLAVLAVILSGLLSKEKKPGGRAFWLFLILYGGFEILFDSMRYDSAFFRSNGFVSVLQVFGLGCVFAAAVRFSVRGIRYGGFERKYPVCWTLLLAGGGLMGYMEYYVQRHGDLYVFSYLIMFLGLCACLGAALTLLHAGSLADPVEQGI